MSTKVRTNKKLISLSNNFYFEFNSNALKNFRDQESFLGWEYSVGQIRLSLLQKFLPECNICFFPITRASLQEACIFKNNENINNYFKNKKNTHILVDWPIEANPHILPVIKSFPQSICLATKETIEAQKYAESETNLLSQIKQNPLIFIEPFDSRRLILKNFHTENQFIHCIGGVESYIQWDLNQSTIHEIEAPTELIIQGSLLTWLQSKFASEIPITLNENKFLKDKLDTACKYFLQFAAKHKGENIVLISGFNFLKQLEKLLSCFKSKDDFEKFIENKVISFDDAKVKLDSKQLNICQPSYETFSEYTSLTGFFARDLLSEKNGIHAWLNFAKKVLETLLFE